MPSSTRSRDGKIVRGREYMPKEEALRSRVAAGVGGADFLGQVPAHCPTDRRTGGRRSRAACERPPSSAPVTQWDSMSDCRQQAWIDAPIEVVWDLIRDVN